MEMPDWFNQSQFGRGVHQITPPPMMQMPQVNSQPHAGGPPGPPQGMLDGPSQMAAGGFTQAPPQMGAGSFQMPPMPPQRPPQEALAQRVAAMSSPAGGLSNAPWGYGPPMHGEAGAPMQLASAGGAPPVTITPDRQVGPGSWLPKGLGGLIDPNSLVGKIMAMSNSKPAPGAPQQQQMTGLLPQLYRGLFG